MRLNACLLSANVRQGLGDAFYISKSSDRWAKGSHSSSFKISIIFRSFMSDTPAIIRIREPSRAFAQLADTIKLNNTFMLVY